MANPKDASFCRECGSRLTSAQPSRLPPNPDVSATAQGRENPLAGTLVVPSKPSMAKEEFGTLASAQPILAFEGVNGTHQGESTGTQPNGVRSPSTSQEASLRPASLQEGSAAGLQDHPNPPGATAALKNCVACGAGNGAGARFCQLCGTPFDRTSDGRPTSPLEAAALPEADLVVIAQDGSPGRRYPLSSARTVIGNGSADVNLRKDPYVSPIHAEIVYRNGRFFLADRGSLNGVFVRLGGSIPLTSGDLLLVGLGVLRFEIVEEAERNLAPQTRNGTRVFGTPPAPRYARLTIQTVEGVARDRYYLSRAETVLGREVGDIVFTDDPFMSRRHAAIRRDPNTNKFTIRDLGSSNGTFVAIREEHALSPGDHVRIGQHLFRLDVRSNG